MPCASSCSATETRPNSVVYDLALHLPAEDPESPLGRRSGWLVAVGGEDRCELGGGGAVEDDAVAAEVELVADGSDALLGCPGGGGGEPLVGDEGGNVVELLGGADDVEPDESSYRVTTAPASQPLVRTSSSP